MTDSTKTKNSWQIDSNADHRRKIKTNLGKSIHPLEADSHLSNAGVFPSIFYYR